MLMEGKNVKLKGERKCDCAVARDYPHFAKYKRYNPVFRSSYYFWSPRCLSAL
jgi:hypothetical protein